MKVLFVVSQYYPYIGGAELLFQRLAEGLADRGHQVKVITTRVKGTSKNEVVNGVEIQRVVIPMSENPFLFSFFSIPIVLKEAKEYDLVQTSSNYAALSAFIGSRIARKKLVLTCLEVLGKKWELVTSKIKSYFFRFIEWSIIHLPYDFYISISHATNSDLIDSGINPQKTTVIYNGLDIPQLNPEEESQSSKGPEYEVFTKAAFTYLYFGRPGVTKGVSFLLEAVPLISEMIPSSKLVLVVATKPEKEYQEILNCIEENNLGENIALVPPFDRREELFRFISQSNCIVIPSLTEGFGFSAVEASSLDVPVVASKAGSLPEVVFGKYVLVEPANPTAIADGVNKVFRGECSYRPEIRFDWETMITEYEKCYLNVINDSRFSR